ncbi:hypothetical protein GCM10010508_29290 [Streptomyces naganishii JCM 4654]|uniref:Uncharacterized protein n=1 Tax=Streptomyces naganishii JCM 4654 TaxID=1306179 RepID=A0A918Y3I9_9ACTN|nr:hypothetical protein GCM10010508_29290 [Streptomyces naganishii JCM 4654]
MVLVPALALVPVPVPVPGLLLVLTLVLASALVPGRLRSRSRSRIRWPRPGRPDGRQVDGRVGVGREEPERVPGPRSSAAPARNRAALRARRSLGAGRSVRRSRTVARTGARDARRGPSRTAHRKRLNLGNGDIQRSVRALCPATSLERPKE